jgi:hypothetical protein
MQVSLTTIDIRVAALDWSGGAGSGARNKLETYGQLECQQW